MTDKDENAEAEEKTKGVLDDLPEGAVAIIKQKYNALRSKAGARMNTNEDGFIDEDKIKAADALIADLCEGSKEKIEEQLDILTELWKTIQAMPDNAARKDKTQEIFTIAHEIKDIGSLCGYNLIAHFAESLRDYISETRMNLKNQRIIIQAHIDAMSTVLKTGISDDGHPVAEELKQKVKIAIEKYH